MDSKDNDLEDQMTPVDVARVCHEANRVLQIIQNDPSIPVSEPWLDLDTETRDSAIDGVVNALGGSTPEQSHDNWMRFKLERGWKLGPKKDEAKREHPMLVPYDELPPAQRIKDDVFLAIVEALRPAVQS